MNIPRAGIIALIAIFGWTANAAAQDQRGWLGISLRGGGGETVVVTDVIPDTAADDAGIRAGDRLVEWNGRRDVVAAINDADLAVGDTVRVGIERPDGSDLDLTLVAGSRPSAFASRFRPEDLARIARARAFEFRGGIDESLRAHLDSLRIRVDSLSDERLHALDRLRIRIDDSLNFDADQYRILADSMQKRLRGMFQDSVWPDFERLYSDDRVWLDSSLDPGADAGLAFLITRGRSGVAGAELTDLSPGLAAYFEADAGALVLHVAPQTPAARTGLIEGDVVTRAAGSPVASVDDLRRALARNSSDAIELEILRHGNRHILTMQR